MRKFYPLQIQINLIDIFNKTIYLIQIKIFLTSCPPTIADGAPVVSSWKLRDKPVKVQQALLFLFTTFFSCIVFLFV